MEKRPLLGMFRFRGTPPPLPASFTEPGANPNPAESVAGASNQSGTTAVATQGAVAQPSEPTAGDEQQRASWFQMRESAESGVAANELGENNAPQQYAQPQYGDPQYGQAGAGIQSMVVPAQTRAYNAIANANQDLSLRTAAHMSTVIAVVLEQRDSALAQAAAFSQQLEEVRLNLTTEHDRFVTDLLQEHGHKQAELERQLKAARDAAERQRVLQAPIMNVPNVARAPGDTASAPELAQAREQIADLRRLLEAAYTEVDTQRTVVPRLEEERDAALRLADDTRVELYGEIEAARDEGTQLQAQLDEAQRQTEEVRDQARDEAHAWSERLSETERELDARREEVSRLRERMAQITLEVQHSRPPPPATSDELMRAREEAQQLRKELIDTKRQLSKVTREFAITKLQRPGARSPQVAVGGVGVMAKTPVPAASGLPITAPVLPIAAARPRMLTPVGLGEHADPELPQSPPFANSEPEGQG